ncbi:peptidoglycan-binding domain-containing protein [Aquamicrobium terrae]
MNTLPQILTGQGGRNLLSPCERPPPRYGRTPIEQGRKRDFDARIVRDVQRKLDSMGYATGVPDGVFGPRTAQALMDFQRDYGLPLTGAPDQPPSGTSASTSPAPQRNL